MSDHFSRISARLLAEQIDEPRGRGGIDRDRGIAIVAHAIAERARRRRRNKVLAVAGAVSAAAAFALLAGFLGGRQATSTEAQHDGASSLRVGWVNGKSFEPGQSLSGRAGGSRVEFGPTTQVRLDEQSVLEYRQGDSTRRFGLLRGAVHLHVDKLAPGQRFLVETPDAEVEVRGTSFHVALAQPGEGCASPRTRVSVDEGVVEVRFHGQTARITPGGHWPERCEEPAPVAPAPSEAAPSEAAPVAPAPSEAAPSEAAASEPASAVKEPAPREAHHVSAASPKAAALPSVETEPPAEHHEPAVAPTRDNASALGEQNNLFAKAVSLRRSGRSAEALAAYEQLIERFPSSALAESARAERLRLLIRLEPARAKTEAARYLARYPRGLASAEARGLLNQP